MLMYVCVKGENLMDNIHFYFENLMDIVQNPFILFSLPSITLLVAYLSWATRKKFWKKIIGVLVGIVILSPFIVSGIITFNAVWYGYAMGTIYVATAVCIAFLGISQTLALVSKKTRKLFLRINWLMIISVSSIVLYSRLWLEFILFFISLLVSARLLFLSVYEKDVECKECAKYLYVIFLSFIANFGFLILIIEYFPVAVGSPNDYIFYFSLYAPILFIGCFFLIQIVLCVKSIGKDD